MGNCPSSMLRRFPGQLHRALGKDQRVDQLIHVAIHESLAYTA